MAARKPLLQRVATNLGRRWVQVGLGVVAVAAAVWAEARYLGPPAAKPSEAKDPNVYKFLHCDVCRLEIPFARDKDGARCPKCASGAAAKGGQVGYFTATMTSVKAGGDGSPWKAFNVAATLTVFAWAVGTYLLLARPVDDPAAVVYQTHCLHCREVIRYKAVGFGMYAQCPGCTLPLKLPDEDEAETADDLADGETEGMIRKLESNLTQTGHYRPLGADDPDADADRPA